MISSEMKMILVFRAVTGLILRNLVRRKKMNDKNNLLVQDLGEYIKENFKTQRNFAKSEGVKPSQITHWLNDECVVVDGVMYSELNKDCILVDGVVYSRRRILSKEIN